MTGCDTSLPKGLLVLLSGPSGSGKGSISRLLLSRLPRLVLSVSATTRTPRGDEQEGVDYFFQSEKDFLELAKNGGFLEYKHVFGMNYYGTPRAFVEEQLDSGNDVLLEIDVMGALEVKREVPDAVSVFVMPPSFAELEKRLIGRGTEDGGAVAVRMRTAYDELKSAHLYDYFVVNDDLDEAAGEVRTILMAARLETQRRLDVIGAIMEGERRL